jgi:hypothetical protein
MIARLYTTLNSPTQTFGDFMCTVVMPADLCGVLCSSPASRRFSRPCSD